MSALVPVCVVTRSAGHLASRERDRDRWWTETPEVPPCSTLTLLNADKSWPKARNPGYTKGSTPQTVSTSPDTLGSLAATSHVFTLPTGGDQERQAQARPDASNCRLVLASPEHVGFFATSSDALHHRCFGQSTRQTEPEPSQCRPRSRWRRTDPSLRPSHGPNSWLQ